MKNVVLLILSVFVLNLSSSGVAAWSQEPDLSTTMNFLERHFRQHAHARLDGGCEQQWPDGENNPQCVTQTCAATIAFKATERIANVDYDCVASGRRTRGGKYRFDPTLIEGASCADHTYYGTQKFIGLWVSAYKAGAIIYSDESASDGGKIEMVSSTSVAAFSQLDQCERAVKAFRHLGSFRSAEPF